MSSFQISILPEFWKDWKQVCKKHRGKEFSSIYSPEELQSLNDETKIESIEVLNAFKNIIINSIEENCLDGISSLYDKQPFLSSGWTIRKQRLATDTSGKSSGLRSIYCINETHILFVFIATKADCANERKLEKVFMQRIKQFLNI